MTIDTAPRNSARRWVRAGVIAILVSVAGAACDTDNLLRVDAPSQMPADDLENPRNAGLLVNGAIADLECAIGAFVLVQGIISDEFTDAQLGAAAWPYDRRDVNLQPGGSYGVNGCDTNQTPGVYRPLSTARWSADNALTYLDQWSPAEVASRDSLIATAALYSGFSYTMLGMAMCTAAIDGGPEVTSSQLLGMAEQRFTRALDVATTASLPGIANAARVGRARVRLFQGDGAGAVTDAAAVPLDFTFNATASQDNGRRYNRVFASNILSRFYSVAPESRNLTTGGVIDPRTAVVNTGTNAADGSTLWTQQKYTGYASPIPIARGAEALLIIAEVEGGQTAIDIINTLRDRAGVPTFGGGTPAEIRQAVIEERRRELWMEGFRQYDIGRFDIPQVPAPGTDYPKGGSYGNTTCLPLPDIERFNNPNIS
jgi:starch-binding outer membrane protein, SusD/RagB family